ncbi:SUMF1/EgtB/PvdO family nonheme iron enzyme, partial [candidate division KSB3 bacterium]|nr:SUMF1/EgtB/PvdO family nonheme iron enzyme [candidate division KSB3 bacterium]MBD3325650.1 SUMF1/EgtB/PvdO family nonheme iron enzyme [candidate division KSB3 bacterium]
DLFLDYQVGLEQILRVLYPDRQDLPPEVRADKPPQIVMPAKEDISPQADPQSGDAWTDPFTSIELVWIPSGRFWMGQTETEKAWLIQQVGKETYKERFINEFPRHEVQIGQEFWLGKYPVTQEQWEAVMGENPSHFNKKRVGKAWRRHPVERVSWDDVQKFLGKLNAQIEANDWTYRLPTEAEWEYACRSESETMYCFGDDVNQLKDYAWYGEDFSKGSTHPVGQLKPNAWGVHDMHGNVWEWCADTWHKTYEGAPKDGSLWGSLDDKKTKMIRGGAWGSPAGLCRAASRLRFLPGSWSSSRGFRVVVSARTL